MAWGASAKATPSSSTALSGFRRVELVAPYREVQNLPSCGGGSCE